MASALLGAMLDPRTRANDPEAVRYVLDAVNRPPRRGMQRAMASLMLRRPSLLDRLERIDVPTLLMTGDDAMLPIETAREQAARIPRGRALHIPGTRHLPAMEDAATTGAALAAWLAEGGR